MTETQTKTDRVKLVTLRNLVGHSVSAAYRLESVIGEGGMGIVFEATQLKLARRVAVKVLKLDGPNAQEAFSRFERELAILANLSHPNIVRVLDSGHDSNLDIYYIAMDLVGGKPLSELIDGYRWEPVLALEIIYQLCGALAQPHSEGVIHRDLKPDNVLVEVIADETLQIRLVDFGIARAFSADRKLTATGVVVGTPHYMAPELVREKELDLRTDIYALGVMLHELLTGSLPFDGSNFMQIGFKHVQAAIPTLDSKIDGFDNAQLESLVSRMMAKEKGDRFGSVSEVRRAIEEIVDEQKMSRLRLDPSLPIDEALEPWRIGVDRRRTQKESAKWLPPNTPEGDQRPEPGEVGVHKAITTTAVEGAVSDAIPSRLPLVIAIVAVVVAIVAVGVALSVTQVPADTGGGAAIQPGTEEPVTPSERDDRSSEASEVPAQTDEQAFEEPVPAALLDVDAGNPDGKTPEVEDPEPDPAESPTERSVEWLKEPSKKRGTVDKTPEKSEKGAAEPGDKDFQKGMDWIQSDD